MFSASVPQFRSRAASDPTFSDSEVVMPEGSLSKVICCQVFPNQVTSCPVMCMQGARREVCIQLQQGATQL